VRFDLQGTFDQATNSLNFFCGNTGWPCSPAYQRVDPRGGHNAQHSIEAAMDK
jgi:hypothetical protein